MGLHIPRFSWSGADARMLGAAIVGVAAGVLIPGPLGWQLRSLVGWNAGAVVLLAAHWVRIFQEGPRTTRTFAAADDPGRRVAWLVAIGASVISLASGVIALRETGGGLPDSAVALRTTLALVGIALAWLVAHTFYTLRYAHLFYARPPGGGIAFPATKNPRDLDFAYFAFTIGMTCQTSDVGIETTEIRTAALGHALLSFVFNTTIVALALNLLLQFLAR